MQKVLVREREKRSWAARCSGKSEERGVKTVRNIKEWSVRVIIKNCNLFKWLWLLWFLWGFAFTSTPSAPYFVGCWGCRDGFKGRKEAGWGRSKADLTTSEHVNPKIYRNDFMGEGERESSTSSLSWEWVEERRYESGFSPTVQGVTRVELFSIGTQKTIKRLESCSRERSEWGRLRWRWVDETTRNNTYIVAHVENERSGRESLWRHKAHTSSRNPLFHQNNLHKSSLLISPHGIALLSGGCCWCWFGWAR